MKRKRLAILLVLSSLTLAACSADDGGNTATTDSSETAVTETSEPATTITIAEGRNDGETAPDAGTLVMRQMYTSPHGTRSFAAVNVLMDGDKILYVQMDEFQYLEPSDTVQGVPNADGGFGEAFPEGMVLASKAVNNEAYSDMMKENGGATQTWEQSMTAITDFASGKTVAELETALADLEALGEDGNPADVISGATFSDSAGYLSVIIDTAKNGMISVGSQTPDAELTHAQLLTAPHGDKSFAITSIALDGDTIAAVFLDEFQFVDAATFGGVPNSDSDFGEGVGEGLVLASKLANNEAYSSMMAENGGATQTYAENMQAIKDFVTGKTIAELEEAVTQLGEQGEEASPSDVVSGATFSDTQGYLQTILDTAKAAQ